MADAVRNFEPFSTWSDPDGVPTERALGWMRAMVGFVGAGAGAIPVANLSGTSAELRSAITDESGDGALLFQNGALGTPSSGIATNLTGTAAGLTAGTVTTNANLTGPITSVGNATSIASKTGTGTKFVVDDTPTLKTPVLGVATATSINKVAFTTPASAATLTIADGKTFTVNNNITIAGVDGKTGTINKNLTFDGTDGTTMTFPSTSATVARTDAGNTFTAQQSFAGRINSTLGNDQNIFQSVAATTGWQTMKILNTSGSLYLGVENSTGGAVVTGSTAYDAVMAGASGISLSANNGTNLHFRLSATGLALAGTLTGVTSLTMSGALSGATTGSFSGDTTTAGNLICSAAGKGLKIKTGANCKMGTATLVGGTVTVSTTAVATGDKIFTSLNTPGGTLGTISAPDASVTNATSFVINSTSIVDTSTVNWMIVTPS